MASGTDTANQPDSPNHSKPFYWHYAWVIVSIIALMQMVGASMRMAFGVLIDPLTENLGWSLGAATGAYAITSIVTALFAPLAGMIGDRYGARKSMAAGAILFAIGMWLTGLITQPWELYLTFGLILGIAQAIFLVPLIPAAMHWFRRHLGIGMGVIMAAWGVGPALAAPIIGYLVVQYGWKGTFWIVGAVSTVIMVGMLAFFRDRPADRGIKPYGFLPGDPEDVAKETDKEKTKQFTGHMRRTAAFWNMSSIHFLGCVGHAVILVFLVPIAREEGISLIAAASLLTVMSAVSVVSRVVVPVLCDNIGTKPVMAIFYVLQGLPVIMLFWTHDLWMFYVFAITFGIGYGGESGGFPILNRKYYGHAPTGSPYGIQMLGAGLGMALGGWVGGPIYDITGSYDLALVVSIVTSLLGAVSIMMLEPTERIIIPDWEAEDALEPDGDQFAPVEQRAPAGDD